ncbi:MAG: hypothetical protein GWN07_32670, partial [Actinobacteria bacterium]|nr:hypothetical protein [Actinomycetota bacterium]NIX24307.1 hypothetical protein [Actinomycetota bacterium]
RVAGAEAALEAAREGSVRLEADLTTALDELEPFRGELKRLRSWVAEVDEVLGGTAKEVRALVADRADLQLRLLDTDDVLES